MSLNVYLIQKGQNLEPRHAIFIREGGQNKEITREEWEARHPDRAPITVEVGGSDGTVYSQNITHNLSNMADAAGIYKALWCPDEIGVTQAKQLIVPLREGLERLKAAPEQFEAKNPANGWGTYIGLVEFIEKYLAACEEYPAASVEVSR